MAGVGEIRSRPVLEFRNVNCTLAKKTQLFPMLAALLVTYRATGGLLLRGIASVKPCTIKFIYACFPDSPKPPGQSLSLRGRDWQQLARQSVRRQPYAAALFDRLTRFGFFRASVFALITVNMSM
jgi:hypothetical protein